MPLTPVTLKSGKIIYAWAAEGDTDAAAIKSNTFELEWPPGSGKLIYVTEADKAGWFTEAEAKEKINTTQAAFVNEAARLMIS
jgi:predicted NUDIX family NTP pyrophosphohydrolase